MQIDYRKKGGLVLTSLLESCKSGRMFAPQSRV